MILHKGERVYWGAPEVMYLEGTITALDEEQQRVTVLVERATPYSAHLIGSQVPFAADGIKPLLGDSPPGVTSERSTQRIPMPVLSEDEKLKRAAAVAVHERYGYALPPAQEQLLIEQVRQVIAADAQMRATILASMDEILRREL